MFLALAEEAAPHLQGAEQRAWLDRLERRPRQPAGGAGVGHGGARAADWPSGLVFALWRFWQQRGYLDEARLASTTSPDVTWDLAPDVRARFAETVGGVAYWQADLEPAAGWYDVALEVRRAAAADRTPGEPSRACQRALQPRLRRRGRGHAGARAGAPPDPAARAMMEEALAIYREPR